MYPKRPQIPLHLSNMADRYTGSVNYTRPTNPAAGLLRRLQEHVPNSAQLAGFLTLVITGGILLLLTGLSMTAIVLGLIFFTPLIILSSPIWVPLGTVLFIVIIGFLSVCGSGIAAVLALSWIYRYFRGLHPIGSDRVDYARSRIADTATHVKDYARGITRVKDAAPGA